MKKSSMSRIKTFVYLIVASVVLYFLLQLASNVFNIDTNIDTGNPVLSMAYYVDYALFAGACL